MKKLIGVIVIMFTLLICIICRHRATSAAKVKPEAGFLMAPLERAMIFSVLLLH